jgi:cytochrome c-type biogenesis protein
MLVVAAQTDRIVAGSALLFLYSIGLVIPFILISLGAVGSARISSFIHRRRKVIQAVGGIALIVVGLLIIVGGWQGIMADLTGRLAQLGWPPL